MPKRESLVKRLLDRSAMSVIYGESHSGKSFFALDLAAHITLGWEWNGRKVRQGRVVYIAAEGGLGMVERLDAFRYHYGVDPTDALRVVPETVDLLRPDADTDALIAEIEAVEGVELVAIDTLARAFGAGNENAPDDMGAFIRNCDRIREETGAHVLIAHHTGKDKASGARGHSALRAATDTEISVEHDKASGIRTATVEKQRDGETGTTIAFRLHPVEIGMDEDEERLTSCVVVHEEEGMAHKTTRRKLTPRQSDAMTQLYSCLDDAGVVPAPETPHYPTAARVVSETVWREYLFKSGTLDAESANPRQDYKRLKQQLRDKDQLREWEGYIWPLSNGHVAAAEA